MSREITVCAKIPAWRRPAVGRSGFMSVIGLALALTSFTASAAVGEPEKPDLKFGFIKLTDMAPLAIAYEKGSCQVAPSSMP